MYFILALEIEELREWRSLVFVQRSFDHALTFNGDCMTEKGEEIDSSSRESVIKPAGETWQLASVVLVLAQPERNVTKEQFRVLSLRAFCECSRASQAVACTSSGSEQ